MYYSPHLNRYDEKFEVCCHTLFPGKTKITPKTYHYFPLSWTLWVFPTFFCRPCLSTPQCYLPPWSASADRPPSSWSSQDSGSGPGWAAVPGWCAALSAPSLWSPTSPLVTESLSLAESSLSAFQSTDPPKTKKSYAFYIKKKNSFKVKIYIEDLTMTKNWTMMYILLNEFYFQAKG